MSMVSSPPTMSPMHDMFPPRENTRNTVMLLDSISKDQIDEIVIDHDSDHNSSKDSPIDHI